MNTKRNLFRDDIKRLRKFLSFNPFFREMDEHMHKKGYCKHGFDNEHLAIEQVWLLAIADVRMYDDFFGETRCLPYLLRDDEWYDHDSCYYIASVRCYIFQARYRGAEGIVDDERAAWDIVEAEYSRLSGIDSADTQDKAEQAGWHQMYADLIRGMYVNRQVDFTRLVGFAKSSNC